MTTYYKYPRSFLATVFRTAVACVTVTLLGGYVDRFQPTAVFGQESGIRALLLKETDRVMTGRIAERGEFYEVEIGPDSRVSIPKHNVAHIAGSLEELYQAKSRGITHASLGDHYQLAHWCLSNGLLAHAAEHYTETAQRSPDHPRVRQLGLAIQERMLQDENFRRYLGLESVATSSRAMQAAAANPSIASAAGSPARQIAAPTVVTTNTSGLGVSDMNIATHPEITRRFADRVQPILLNRCSQTACHGAQSKTTLRLSSPYASAASRITSENMASVLKQISTGPNQSYALVHYATTAHGIQPSPAIAQAERKLIQELEDWIAFVRNPVVTAVVNSGTLLGSQVRTAEQFKLEPFATEVTLVPVNPGASKLRSVPRDLLPGAPQTATAPFPSSAFPPGIQPPAPSEIDALDAQLRTALGELPLGTGVSSADPFDPAEFNRRNR